MKLNCLLTLAVLGIFFASCEEDEPTLQLPEVYSSTNYDANVVAERTVVGELSSLTTAVNEAESNAQSTAVASISYPATLRAVTFGSYATQVENWISELVLAANDDDGFQNPGLGNTPAAGENGGLLGSRLLDENGLELEQMIQKGSFGAALYNHALTVISGDLSSSKAIDKLVEVHGATPAFDAEEVTAAATYSKRRSNVTAGTGFLYDIRDNLIEAKAAIEGGSAFNDRRDAALEAFLLNWEKSNFATVIYYCNATKTQLQAATAISDQTERNLALGNALHAYAEGVAFAAGFRGISQKEITDNEIDSILELLLAPSGQTPESFRFLNEVTLLANLDQIIEDIQDIYGFSDEEVTSFYINN